MTLSMIVAMTDQNVIGANNRIPWRFSADLKRFKKITMGHSIVMGRKTYESIGRALPGRRNIVVTRNPHFSAEETVAVHGLDEALALTANDEGERFVIGGSSLFAEALPRVAKIYLTLIHRSFPGDVYFPPIDLKRDFQVTEKIHGRCDQEPVFHYSFITAERRTV